MEAFPREFGRYRLTGILGEGGMAQVFRAETRAVAGVSKPVAIKCMLQNLEQEHAGLLIDEARIWVRLQHPNIVSVVEFGEHEGSWFLALELIDGMSAADLLDLRGSVPVPEALCIIERMARALGYAHELTEDGGRPLGIIHRDVKPGNILLSVRGEVKLSDFGIARAADRANKTQVGVVKGSLQYLSPEQARGENIDGKSDLFALGCCLHKLLTGRSLLDLPREDLFRALANGTIPDPDPQLPDPVRELITSMTLPFGPDRPTGLETARWIRTILQPAHVDDLEPSIGRMVREARANMPPPAEATAVVDGPPEASGAFTSPMAVLPGDGVDDQAATYLGPLPGHKQAPPAEPLSIRPVAGRPGPAPIEDDGATVRRSDPRMRDPDAERPTNRDADRLDPSVFETTTEKNAAHDPLETVPPLDRTMREPNPRVRDPLDTVPPLDRTVLQSLPRGRDPLDTVPPSQSETIIRPNWLGQEDSGPRGTAADVTAPKPQALDDTAEKKRAPQSRWVAAALWGGAALAVLAGLAIAFGIQH